MWFRAVLLFIFCLLVFQIVFRVLRRLFRPAPGRRQAPGTPQDRIQRPWQPSDVIDVPFRETPDDPPGPRPGEKCR